MSTRKTKTGVARRAGVEQDSYVGEDKLQRNELLAST